MLTAFSGATVLLNYDLPTVYIENMDSENGLFYNRRRLDYRRPVPLVDGARIDLPGFRLEFTIAGCGQEDAPLPEGGAEQAQQIPACFYTPPPPPASPLLSTLLDDRREVAVWQGGVTQLQVVNIVAETDDCRTFQMRGMEPLLFSYQPGQYVTFLLNIDGRDVKRAYSMSSSPSRPYLLEVTVKRVQGGLVSNWLCDRVRLGDRLTVEGPYGKFTCSNYPSARMLFIAAGSGMTPILSMCSWIADTASDVDVKLLASFKSPADILFRRELELLAARCGNFQIGYTVTRYSDRRGQGSWTGFTGRVNEAMLKLFVPDLLERDIFMCGPGPFAEAVKKILRQVDFDMSRYHSESFSPVRSARQPLQRGEPELRGAQHRVKFTRSGISVATDEHITLLELAEAHGIEVDYSCRAGSCGECEVKCRGEVAVGEECEIDARTRAEGFVYACCSTAKSDLEIDI